MVGPLPSRSCCTGGGEVVWVQFPAEPIFFYPPVWCKELTNFTYLKVGMASRCEYNHRICNRAPQGQEKASSSTYIYLVTYLCGERGG